jgi:hypothetical protein
LHAIARVPGEPDNDPVEGIDLLHYSACLLPWRA